MRWVDKLERRWGRLGIPQLMNLILIGQAAVWLIVMIVNYRLYDLLLLSRGALAAGQLWRLITFIFVPSLTGIFYFALELYFYWWVGNALERSWGDFRFTVYWLVGIVGAWLSCLISGSGDTSGIFLSLFFAYAWMWPEQQILLFFVLPIKVKWMGWAAGALWVFQLVQNLIFRNFAGALSLVFGLAGFLVFFGPELWRWCGDEITSLQRRRRWKNSNRR